MENLFIQASLENLLDKNVGIGTTCLLSELESPFVQSCNKTPGYYQNFTTDYKVRDYDDVLDYYTKMAVSQQGIGPINSNCSCGSSIKTNLLDQSPLWKCLQMPAPEVPPRQIQNSTDVVYNLSSLSQTTNQWLLDTFSEFIERR